VTFIANGLSRHEELFVSAAGNALRLHVASSILLIRPIVGSVLIVWMNDHVAYTVVMAEQAMRAIAETAGEYTDHVLGLGRRVRVIVGYRLPTA
jgi:hypothetical protein